ncbi:endonuclease MutS2 [Roseburia sp. MSJ-14]|uniref:endonuclease MutS2 n=1 Tax=Roseburia sp. MSJ-14 TaxID=2841514 RepID=UPI001C116208|nr:endonuclease MutS2 [Roseburia sp. MSJ-14]MBU5473272.1 endonuclease MutS2 [Roseburia sp. MSJ-14]
MNEKVLKTLEYNKIIDLLTEYATSESGRELCRKLKPMTDLEAIEDAQAKTRDALSRIFKKGSLSFSGLHNIGASLKRLEIGGTLGIEELLRIASLLEVAKRAKAYSRSDREDTKADSLDELFDKVEPLTPLLDEIRRCIISEDEIADDASSTLKNIRRSMKNINDKIRSQMNTMLNNTDTRNLLQDAVVTMRNGRYCLPVKAEAKGQVPGMIHDQSSTGSTIFIEPMAVVKLNNDLKELFLKEQEEIEVILANLSAQVAEYISFLQDDYQVLTELDFIFAKGSLAKSYNGTAPLFNTEHRIRIRKGRHPLLDSHKVVPIDIHLGDDFDLLIVTGPNTGGKTVSIKTVGLFTLMGQAGLHIPANDRSELSIFHEVFADIGDEQSIEQSLSTFSSHMTNIISILDRVDEDSLVLFDELCAGTDPTEGAALAISILTRLHNYGIRTMATTHYSELKVFALSTPGVENACCEFSVETLSPTYRLLIGIPGKSNAFAISGKLGLSEDIITEAKKHLTEQDESFEDLISDLESSRVTIEKERLEVEQYKQEIASLKKKLEQKQERIDSQKEKIIRQANEEAHAILREAKEVADQTIKNFHKYGKATPSMKDMEQERSKLRDKMNSLEKDMSLKQKNAQTNHKVPKKLRIGDTVKVLSMNLTGTVHTLPNEKGDLYVQMGILRSLVNIKDLILVEETPVLGNKKKSTGAGKIKMAKSASVSTEINLIGKTTDEAIALLDKYLDDAYIAHMPSVRIVHGKGTGALRNAVHNHLKRLKYIKSYRLGEFGEGDAGVTIAEFK